MKRPSVNLILQKKKATDTHGYIYIRVGVPGTKRYELKSTGYKVAEHAWNPDPEVERVAKNYPEATTINIQIHKEKSRLITELNNDAMQDVPFTKEHIRQRLGGKDNRDLLTFFKEHIDYMSQERKSKNEKGKKKLSPNYIKKLTGEYNRLFEYSGGKLSFKQITVAWLEKYEQKLSETLDAGTSLPVAISKLMMILGKAEGKGLFDMKSIASYDTPAYKSPQRPYLTIAQLDSIEKLLYGGNFDGMEESKTVAAFFLIECYSGVRFSDWNSFTIEKLQKKEYFKVERTKKTDAPVFIELSGFPRLNKVVKFIKDNNLKMNFSEQHVNRVLKIIGALIKAPFPLTTHVGRHTCATMLLELGWLPHEIAEALAISTKTVEIYAKTTRRTVANAVKRVGGL